ARGKGLGAIGNFLMYSPIVVSTRVGERCRHDLDTRGRGHRRCTFIAPLDKAAHGPLEEIAARPRSRETESSPRLKVAERGKVGVGVLGLETRGRPAGLAEW